MAGLTLTLLGGFQARLGAGPVLLPTKKVQALLAYLALPPGREHARDKLAVLLWGDLTQGQARQNLRQALFALRHATELVRPACLCSEGASIALNAKAVDVDAMRFERLVGEGTLEALGKAVELYRGELLEGLTPQGGPFEEWLMGERERLRELAVEALAGLLAQERAAGTMESALQTGLRLIALDPLQEPVHRTLMRLYAQLGRRGSALHQYQLCVGILQRELGVEPEEETKQLYQDILRRPPSRAVAAALSPRGRASSVAGRSPFPVATDTPLTGRAEEMARLRAAWTGAIAGQGQAVAVVGEAGVGKTRLVAELATEADQGQARVLVGRSHESEQILPFGPWAEALRMGRVPGDRQWFLTQPLAIRRELGRLLPEVGSVDGEPQAPPDYLQLFEGVALLLKHMADQEPTILILEDLHWADEMSVRLLAFIARRVQAWRLLVLATARAEDMVDAPILQRTLGELAREPHVATLALGPLSQHDTVGLVQALLRPGSDEGAVAHLSEQVWRTSGGNPLVVVEAMRAAAQEALAPGLETLPVPDRVRDLIGRQLDRLDARSREVIALASVVGREFEFGILQHASGLGEEEAAQAVEELTRRRVLHSVGEQLDFTHDRVREVAYSRILAPRRRALHRRVAEGLATLHANDLEPHHLAVGLHYTESEVWDKAAIHLRQAGAGAVQRSANREALACFERALAALAHLPESPSTLEQAFEIRLALRPVLTKLGTVREALKHLCEAEGLADRLNDDARRARVYAFMTGSYSMLGELDVALARGTRALEIARRLGDLKIQVATMYLLEQAHSYRGDFEQVVELATTCLAILPADWVYEDFGLTAPASIFHRAILVRGLTQLGRFTEAAECEADAIGLAESTQHAYTISLAYQVVAVLYLHKGEWLKARSLIERWIGVLRKGSVGLHLSIAVASSALVRAQLGEEDESLSRLREGEHLVEQDAAKGIVGHSARGYVALGRTCLLLGQLDAARRLTARAIEISSQHFANAADALHLLGDIASHPGRFDAESGEVYYHKALALAEPRGMRPLVAHCHLGLGKLYRRTGMRQEAQAHLTRGTAMYREMDMRFWLEQAEAELGDRES